MDCTGLKLGSIAQVKEYINKKTEPSEENRKEKYQKWMVLFIIFREKLRLPYSLQTNVILTENYLLHGAWIEETLDGSTFCGTEYGHVWSCIQFGAK